MHSASGGGPARPRSQSRPSPRQPRRRRASLRRPPQPRGDRSPRAARHPGRSATRTMTPFASRLSRARRDRVLQRLPGTCALRKFMLGPRSKAAHRLALEQRFQLRSSDGCDLRQGRLRRRLRRDPRANAVFQHVHVATELLQPARHDRRAHAFAVDQHEARVAHRHPLVRRLHELPAGRMHRAGKGARVEFLGRAHVQQYRRAGGIVEPALALRRRRPSGRRAAP